VLVQVRDQLNLCLNKDLIVQPGKQVAFELGIFLVPFLQFPFTDDVFGRVPEALAFGPLGIVAHSALELTRKRVWGDLRPHLETPFVETESGIVRRL
jgi:hypothetical protein